ncbi:MAG: hypothetical protein ACPHOL_09915, partial [Candidatus Puniceispirillum sp.]
QDMLEMSADMKKHHDFDWPAISYGPCEKFRRADLDIIDAIGGWTTEGVGINMVMDTRYRLNTDGWKR